MKQKEQRTHSSGIIPPRFPGKGSCGVCGHEAGKAAGLLGLLPDSCNHCCRGTGDPQAQQLLSLWLWGSWIWCPTLYNPTCSSCSWTNPLESVPESAMYLEHRLGLWTGLFFRFIHALWHWNFSDAWSRLYYYDIGDSDYNKKHSSGSSIPTSHYLLLANKMNYIHHKKNYIPPQELALGIVTWMVYFQGLLWSNCLPASLFSEIIWPVKCDTIYAHQDKRDDVLTGLKSMVLWLCRNTKQWLKGFSVRILEALWLVGPGQYQITCYDPPLAIGDNQPHQIHSRRPQTWGRWK